MSDETPAPKHRHIRSYTLRQGRFTDAQQRAFDEHWARYGLEYRGWLGESAEQPRNFDEVFGRIAPLILEIGFGNGEQLRHAAQSEPGANHIGIEVHGPGVGRLLNGLDADGATNVRVYRHDAVDVLTNEVADASLAQVRLYFPDPWPKKRHHKRRIVQPAFAALVARKLAPGGLFHLATDWENYKDHMLEVLEASPFFRNAEGPRGVAPCPPWRRDTHFERRGTKLGHGTWDLVYAKVDAPAERNAG
ncbi:MAG TPA: tRNA (guanosine(46)-N7)-methyltransferase TrmB [Xanthomonadales bacterium]|nr:tRNA (guanosine(46)-N7)-methyltransferase TrmB [Xanthomonadales bacterium]